MPNGVVSKRINGGRSSPVCFRSQYPQYRFNTLSKLAQNSPRTLPSDLLPRLAHVPRSIFSLIKRALPSQRTT